MPMNTGQALSWKGRMGSALTVLEATDPGDNAAELLAVDVLAIEFKVTNGHPSTFASTPSAVPGQPRVKATYPNELNIEIPLNAVITVEFSQEMDHATIIAANFLYSEGQPSFTYGMGGAYTAFTSVIAAENEGGRTVATLTKAGGLVAGKGYMLRVLVDCLNMDGLPLVEQFDMIDTFNTIAA